MPVRKALCARDSYEAMVANHASSSADIERANEALQQPRQDDRARSSTIACRSRRRPLWQSLPPAPAMTPTIEASLCVLLLCHACSQCFIHATGGFAHITHCAFSIFCCLLFVLIVGVAWLHMMNPVNREAVPLVHTIYLFMCCVFFSSHTPLSFERESSETILLFSDSGGSEVEHVKDCTRSR